jgi:hypothetical protein
MQNPTLGAAEPAGVAPGTPAPDKAAPDIYYVDCKGRE